MHKGKDSIINYSLRILIKLNFIGYVFRLNYKIATMRQ